MNIALDWDGTCSADIHLFLMFARLARASGHKVYIVTMRYSSEVNDPKHPEKAIPDFFLKEVSGLICTKRKAKRQAVQEAGIHIDIWIDDNPQAVDKSAVEIWGWSTSEGVVAGSIEEAEQHRAQLTRVIEENSKTQNVN